MNNINPTTAAAGDPEGQALSVPGLLNILVRGRLVILVVTLLGLVAGLGYSFLTRPLYLATAQVRPGIVAYSPDGGGVREWALKDVVRWFRTGLFWQDLREQETFGDFKGPPDIMAEFIPSGPQFMQGGDVITLKNLHADPLVALATLDQAIKSFNRQAALDSLGSTMYLTIGGARVRMDRIGTNIKQLQAEAERVTLQIAEEKRKLTMVEVQDRTLVLELESLNDEIALRQRMVAAAEDQAATARERLAQADRIMSHLSDTETSTSGVNPPSGGGSVDQVLLRAVDRQQAGNVSDLLTTIDLLNQTIFNNQVMADSLQTRVQAIRRQIELVELEREVSLAKDKADIQQRIDDLNLKIEFDLPTQRAQLENELAAEQVRLDVLSPLEQIGRISISEKPVRPRKLRATAILTVLGFFGSLFLVLVLEYYRNNQAAIMADKRG